MGNSAARVVWDAHASLGEGPVWVAAQQALYWVDIKAPAIHRFTPTSGERRTWSAPEYIGAIHPARGGGFVAAMRTGIYRLELESVGRALIAAPEADRPRNRFNDASVDREGRLWAGTMDDQEVEASGSLYRLDPSGACTQVDSGYLVTNGPAFSPDGRRMYCNDSARRVTWAFDVSPDGTIGRKRPFYRYEATDGYPDGMTVDAEGHLWVAMWGGWQLLRLTGSAELVARVPMPVEQPTSLAFGGADLATLYVTSARIGLSDSALGAQPLAGALFSLLPGVRGLQEVPWGG